MSEQTTQNLHDALLALRQKVDILAHLAIEEAPEIKVTFAFEEVNRTLLQASTSYQLHQAVKASATPTISPVSLDLPGLDAEIEKTVAAKEAALAEFLQPLQRFYVRMPSFEVEDYDVVDRKTGDTVARHKYYANPASPRTNEINLEMAQEEAARLNCHHCPQVGMGVTKGIGSDRYAYTVTRVYPAVHGEFRKIEVRQDIVRHVSGNEQSGNVVYECTPNPNGSTYTLTLRSNNRWVAQGMAKDDCYRWSIGHRSPRSDPSF